MWDHFDYINKDICELVTKEQKKGLNLYKVLSLMEHATETLAREAQDHIKRMGIQKLKTAEGYVTTTYTVCRNYHETS